jgi:hypothetical protein
MRLFGGMQHKEYVKVRRSKIGQWNVQLLLPPPSPLIHCCLLLLLLLLPAAAERYFTSVPSEITSKKELQLARPE